MRVHACFKNIDDAVAAIKAATIKAKIAKKIFMKLACHHFLTLLLQDGQFTLELHCTVVITFLLFVLLSTIVQMADS